ncbi:MAG: homocysteine S-methyltransferase family protein [Planctomycetota bacterium]|jgi:5-methyltetrahydrofolate--homocysteine methyltransferase
MDRIVLRERIRQGPFLLDGAMGTQLIARGVEPGRCNDYLNVESPQIVLDVHKAYFEAGSDAVLTNTFGGNLYALGRHRFADKVAEVNRAGGQAARRAAGEAKYVLGDIGPSGDFLEPLGTLKADELREAFAQQARGLLAGGVDGFIIETMTALEEMQVAIVAVKSVCDLPVFASMVFDRAGDDFKTMMGVGVEAAVAKMVSLRVDSVGFNCGTASLEDYVELAGRFVSAVEAAGGDVLILAEPNAGRPELVDGKAVYNVSREDFAAAVARIRSAGVSIIGGCCGTSPEHIQAMANELMK